MPDWMSSLVDTADFPPRWECGTWSSPHGWTHIISDSAIFGAYVAIPIALAVFVRRRSDLPFPKLFWLFCAFIFSCGFGHLIEATIFWQPWYRLSALVKAITAVVSWATVLAVLPIIPQALRFRSPADLEDEVTQRTEELARVNLLLSEKNEELEQFLRTVSHDLKSPLVTVRGFMGVLEEELGPTGNADVRDAIERINRSTTRMGELLNDLLELSRIGRVRNEPTHINTNQLIHEIVEEMPRDLILNRSVEIGELPPVTFDEMRLRQVFSNLIQNALSYGTTDTATSVSVVGSDCGDSIEFRVIDRGPGVPADMRERVFFPFERLRTDKSGTGIGLAIVARIVSVSGGAVIAEETPGGGCTIVATIPKQASS